MTKLIKVFGEEFINGVKETPRMYFAPVSAMFRAVYQEAFGEAQNSQRTKRTVKSRKSAA